ncbi:hypothetical protein RCL_jg22518.t1 [Rhizophagus clarus]|uniref:Uncharacterized protein n=1 Tax=Rhizophagus clarus TaxID=94130 RepID=A0A8H3MF28_9GLOM|nr:hypothetical protein RCL_jg22518.t1 [Rhizophagus clarus]
MILETEYLNAALSTLSCFFFLYGFASLKYYFVKIPSTCLPSGIPLHSVVSKTLSSGGIFSSSFANGRSSFLPVVVALIYRIYLLGEY